MNNPSLQALAVGNGGAVGGFEAGREVLLEEPFP